MSQRITTTAANRRHGSAAPAGAAGFSLLEVLIALAIVSISLVALMALNNRAIDVHQRLRKITQATMLAQHKMAEVESAGQAAWQAGAKSEGLFAEPFNSYGWRLAYSTTELAGVRMITVTVYWGEEKNNESVDITSFIF
ncbi:MAG: hypothetical protein C0613_08545 [Desulfobulbaceae bacterium]|nr:MAG: hypothetical protein C0613_08545 [Desulfobulbaceae bacterium]